MYTDGSAFNADYDKDKKKINSSYCYFISRSISKDKHIAVEKS